MRVGDKLYWVRTDFDSYSGYITITKVGRKYAYFERENESKTDERYRIFIEKMLVETNDDAKRRCGTLYPSEVVFEQAQRRNATWFALVRYVEKYRYSPPPGSTELKIKEAGRLLGSWS